MTNQAFGNNNLPPQQTKHRRGGISVTLIVIIVLVVLFALFLISKYNGMVQQQEAVNTSWSQVENQYQRRADLIPNLVETVKGYASHERETLEGVIEARSKATSTTIDPSNMTEEQLAKFQTSQAELSNALSRLMVVVERYPELKRTKTSVSCRLSSKERRTALR